MSTRSPDVNLSMKLPDGLNRRLGSGRGFTITGLGAGRGQGCHDLRRGRVEVPGGGPSYFALVWGEAEAFRCHFPN